MKRFGRIALTAVLAGAMVVTPVMAAPTASELEQSKKEAENEVSSLKSQLAEIVGKISQLEEDLVVKGEEIAQAEEDLKEAEETEKKQYEDMKLRIQFMYEKGDDSFLEALMTANSFTDLINKAEYVQNVHSYDREKLEEYIATKKKVADLKTTLEEEQKTMQTMQADFKSEEDNLNNLIASKQSEIESLGAQLEDLLAEAAWEAAGGAAGGTGTGGNGGGGGFRPVYGGSGNTATAAAIVAAARSQVGVPYAWGGVTPGVGLDCSGLVMYCHSVAGISLSHSSGSQGNGARVSDPQPGDVVCYSGHVGIYIGGGQMIHAPEPGQDVKVANVYGSPWYVRYW